MKEIFGKKGIIDNELRRWDKSASKAAGFENGDLFSHLLNPDSHHHKSAVKHAQGKDPAAPSAPSSEYEAFSGTTDVIPSSTTATTTTTTSSTTFSSDPVTSGLSSSTEEDIELAIARSNEEEMIRKVMEASKTEKRMEGKDNEEERREAEENVKLVEQAEREAAYTSTTTTTTTTTSSAVSTVATPSTSTVASTGTTEDISDSEALQTAAALKASEELQKLQEAAKEKAEMQEVMAISASLSSNTKSTSTSSVSGIRYSDEQIKVIKENMQELRDSGKVKEDTPLHSVMKDWLDYNETSNTFFTRSDSGSEGLSINDLFLTHNFDKLEEIQDAHLIEILGNSTI